jgi:hypothetical protein
MQETWNYCNKAVMRVSQSVQIYLCSLYDLTIGGRRDTSGKVLG